MDTSFMLKATPTVAEQSRRPLNDSHKELLGMPTITSQMPVSFGNDREWTGLDGYCKGCGKMIRPDLFRGRVSKPFPYVAVVDAVGVCHPCKLVTTFHYRLHDDMRMSGKDTDGRWTTWYCRRSWRALLIRIFRQLIGFAKGSR